MCCMYTHARPLYQRKESIAIMEEARAGDTGIPIRVSVPPRTLLVLCGPAGSGKSTFAARRFGATIIVSSDYCRELICDDATNQQVNRDTFDLFYYIISKRLYLGRFTIADSTALYPDTRRRLREIARRYGFLACLLIFDTPQEICSLRNELRGRKVEAKVMPYHAALLQQTLRDAPNEGWDQIHVLREENMDAIIEIQM